MVLCTQHSSIQVASSTASHLTSKFHLRVIDSKYFTTFYVPYKIYWRTKLNFEQKLPSFSHFEVLKIFLPFVNADDSDDMKNLSFPIFINFLFPKKNEKSESGGTEKLNAICMM